MQVADWGSIDYELALARQRALAASVARGQAVPVIVSCQHPATVTLGRHAPKTDVLVDTEALAGQGIGLVRSDRGGRATFHGPGQAVVYPIVRLADHRLSVKGWVALLEERAAHCLETAGVPVQKRCQGPGLWAAGGKIASIGLRIVRGVSYHGMAINVSLDVSAFDCIVTCGAPDAAVTDIRRETGIELDTDGLGRDLAQDIAAALTAEATTSINEQAQA